jgi:hypothetical protein
LTYEVKNLVSKFAPFKCNLHRYTVGLLRDGLPDAIEKGVVRVMDGPDYNTPLSMFKNPPFGRLPALSIMWQAMASTTSFKVPEGNGGGTWPVCAHHASKRKAVCFAWAEFTRMLGCGILPMLLQIDGWEEYIRFDGFLAPPSFLPHVSTEPNPFLPPLPHVVDLSRLPSSISTSMLKYVNEAEIERSGAVQAESS